MGQERVTTGELYQWRQRSCRDWQDLRKGSLPAGRDYRLGEGLARVEPGPTAECSGRVRWLEAFLMRFSSFKNVSFARFYGTGHTGIKPLA